MGSGIALEGNVFDLVMDTGASIAPHNHFELGQLLLTDYVWGRQIGENAINP